MKKKEGTMKLMSLLAFLAMAPVGDGAQGISRELAAPVRI
jgi:hypothetical protein